MQITEMHLRQLIRQIINEEAKHDYGSVLFGDERGLDEPDTQSEKELSKKFSDYFSGETYAIRSNDVQRLKKLHDEGKYLDILQIPSYAKRAWRVIEVKHATKKYFDRLNPRGNTFNDPKLFEKQLNLPVWRHAVNSWTISPNALRDLAVDILNEKSYEVIFSVDLTTQRDAFILNPTNLEKINPHYFWQAEIWQIKPIVCDKWVVVSANVPKQKLLEAAEMVL